MDLSTILLDKPKRLWYIVVINWIIAMPRAFTHKFSSNENQFSNLGKAISHPARVAILKTLLREKGCRCSKIVESLPLSQPTVSQHLRTLERSGLIRGKMNGTSVIYYIDDRGWERARRSLYEFFNL